MVQYNFSAQFLKIAPPDTSFGNAWESLCYDLLSAELNDPSLQRFGPPDKGIDIWHRDAGSAYQCKSDERGAFGTLSANDSIASLKTALNSRRTFTWRDYLFATNANYTGNAVEKILEECCTMGMDASCLLFRGPEYWSRLCEKHYHKVYDRLDYRIRVTEAQVEEAFHKARYYDKFVKKFVEMMSRSPIVLKIKNNRTPVQLELPFSRELSVENCVDVIREILGVSLKWTNFTDLKSSAGPSISLTINRRALTFSKTIEEVENQRGDDDLEFWITIRWQENSKDDGVDVAERLMFCCHKIMYEQHATNFAIPNLITFNQEAREKETIERAKNIIQMMIWKGVSELI